MDENTVGPEPTATRVLPGGAALVRDLARARSGLANVATALSRPSRRVRLAGALLAVPLAVALRFALVPFIGMGIPYITLFPVTVAVALFAGMRMAVVTGLLGAVAFDYYFIAPLGAVEATAVGFFRVAVVTLTTVYVGWVGDVLREARKGAETRARELRSSEERLAFALSASRTGAWDLDWSDHTVERSAEHDRIFGYDEALARWTYDMFLDHVVPADRSRVDEQFQAAAQTGCDLDIECRIRRADGERRWIRAAGQQRTDASDGRRRLVGIVQDITDSKGGEEALERQNQQLSFLVAEQTLEIRRGYDLMKAERQRFYGVLETLPVYVSLLDADHRFAFANRSFRERFGDPLDLRCHEHLFGRDVPCEGCETYRVLNTGLPGEWAWRGPDGRFYEVYDFPFTDADGAPLVMEVGVDVTAAKEAENALRSANEELDRTVAALTTSHSQLRALASELTVAEQRERQRLAVILHDHLQQLLVAALIRSVPLQRSDDPAVRQAAAELSDTVRESLDSSRSLTAELSPPILQHGGLIGALRWLAKWMKEKHALTVKLDIQEEAPPVNDVVANVLFQAVRELLFNVVKHAGVAAAYVGVRLDDGRIAITVRDEGAGFEPGDVRALDLGGGTGLGLATMRERLQHLGGALSITSAPGRGSRFDLVVPIDGLPPT